MINHRARCLKALQEGDFLESIAKINVVIGEPEQEDHEYPPWNKKE
jgi:hypothetical protein